MPSAGDVVAPEKVWIANAVLALIVAEAQARMPLETGGMVLGYRGEDGRELVVTDATGPGPDARHRRYSFTPDGRWQQRELAAFYEQSRRITTYLGDWHSHPGGGPVPSPRDLKTARKVRRRRAARTHHPVTLILGIETGELVLAAHVLHEDRLTAVPWEPYEP